MLLRYLLARRDGTPDTDLSFHPRGTEVSRLEGFSDAVFGFAITLLVISGSAPATSDQLIAMSHAVLPFIASFFALFGLWRAQFNFFRRYGLEDRRTTTLTGLLLLVVLLAVYPVKFLFTVFFDVLPLSLIRGDDSIKAVMHIGAMPKVLLLYSLGFAGVTFIFARLYAHAAARHTDIGLSDLELFDTRVIERRWLAMCTSALVLAAWSISMVVMAPVAGDTAWVAGYAVMFPVLLVVNVTQRNVLRRFARERQLLTAGA